MDIKLPDTVDVKALATEGAIRKVIMFAPYSAGEGLYSQNVYAKEIFFPTFAWGYIEDFGPDYLLVNTYSEDGARTVDSNGLIAEPVRFSLTDDTIATDLIEDGIETVIVYDEDTMEAVALFVFRG